MLSEGFSRGFSSTIIRKCVSHVQLFVTPWTVAHQAPPSMGFSRQEYWSGVPLPSPTISQSLLQFMSTELVMLSNHLILCHPFVLLPSTFPSIGVFSNESALHIRWSKLWSFSFALSPSNEYSGLISFKIDWFDLFAVQETLKSLLQHHSLKASILQHSAFFMDQPSHLYMTTGKDNKGLKRPCPVACSKPSPLCGLWCARPCAWHLNVHRPTSPCE